MLVHCNLSFGDSVLNNIKQTLTSRHCLALYLLHVRIWSKCLDCFVCKQCLVLFVEVRPETPQLFLHHSLFVLDRFEFLLHRQHTLHNWVNLVDNAFRKVGLYFKAKYLVFELLDCLPLNQFFVVILLMSV